MAEYMNFEVGQKFPLPIKAKGDGGLFQVDSDGMMFILQLSHTDVIAHEVFRTGRMEFAFFEVDGVLFLLYQIDGIFRTGWGDAPLSLGSLDAAHRPSEGSLADPTLHLYLVNPTLGLLLAQRDVVLNDDCTAMIRHHVQTGKALPEAAFQQKVAGIWAQYSPEAMRERAAAVQEVPLAISVPGQKLH